MTQFTTNYILLKKLLFSGHCFNLVYLVKFRFVQCKNNTNLSINLPEHFSFIAHSLQKLNLPQCMYFSYCNSYKLIALLHCIILGVFLMHFGFLFNWYFHFLCFFNIWFCYYFYVLCAYWTFHFYKWFELLFWKSFKNVEILHFVFAFKLIYSIFYLIFFVLILCVFNLGNLLKLVNLTVEIVEN